MVASSSVTLKPLLSHPPLSNGVLFRIGFERFGPVIRKETSHCGLILGLHPCAFFRRLFRPDGVLACQTQPLFLGRLVGQFGAAFVDFPGVRRKTGRPAAKCPAGCVNDLRRKVR